MEKKLSKAKFLKQRLSKAACRESTALPLWWTAFAVLVPLVNCRVFVMSSIYGGAERGEELLGVFGILWGVYYAVFAVLGFIKRDHKVYIASAAAFGVILAAESALTIPAGTFPHESSSFLAQAVILAFALLRIAPEKELDEAYEQYLKEENSK